MADVAGVLLDHVHEDVADFDLLAADIHGPPEVVDPLDVRLREGDLSTPGGPGLLDHGRVGEGTVEVEVAVLITVVEAGDVLAV